MAEVDSNGKPIHPPFIVEQYDEEQLLDIQISPIEESDLLCMIATCQCSASMVVNTQCVSNVNLDTEIRGCQSLTPPYFNMAIVL